MARNIRIKRLHTGRVRITMDRADFEALDTMLNIQGDEIHDIVGTYEDHARDGSLKAEDLEVWQDYVTRYAPAMRRWGTAVMRMTDVIGAAIYNNSTRKTEREWFDRISTYIRNGGVK